MVKFIKDCKICTDGINVVEYKKNQLVEITDAEMIALKGNYKKPTKVELTPKKIAVSD